MKSEIKIPPMGESITEVSIGVILKESGSQVSADDEIVEIETDKVNQPLYAPQSGVLTLSVKTGETAKIGQSIGWIEQVEGQAIFPVKEAPKEPVKEKAAASEKAQLKEEKKEEKTQNPSIAKTEKQADQARVSRESSLEELKPADKIEKPPLIKKAVPTGAREMRRPLSKIRKVIAQRLVESQQTMAMLTTFNEIDMTQVIALREKYKEPFAKHWNVKLGFMSFFVKAVVSALQAHPDVNSYIDGDEVVHRKYYDIGIAVGSDRGLVVPVVRNCDQLSFAQIEQAIEDYANQVKSGGIAIDSLQGGGFTITNGGVYGSLLSTPIVNPPQCGILGLHKIEKRPIVVDDKIVICPMMYVALSYDHRLLDGREAVLFLTHIKNSIEDPSRLLLDI